MKISQSTYSQIENNQVSITLDKLNQIARILEKQPLELIQLNGQPVFNMFNNGNSSGIGLNDNSSLGKDFIENFRTRLQNL